jgi:hypothetical protein
MVERLAANAADAMIARAAEAKAHLKVVFRHE